MNAILETRPQEIADLPMPPGLPLLGQTLQINRGRFHQQLEAWHAQLGDRFRLKLAGRDIVVMSDPTVIQQALRDRPDAIGRTMRLRQATAELGFEGIFSAHGDDWRKQRPMIMAGFDPGHIRQYFPSLVKVSERFRGRWARAADAGQAIDLQADLMRYTVDVVAGLAFGADINTLEKDQDVIQDHLDQMLPALFKRILSPFAYWNYFKLPADRKLDEHVKALNIEVQRFIAQARARLEADPALQAAPGNLIEAMIVARDRPESGLTDKDVASNVLTMLLAGEDTTANTLAWMLYLLSRSPQVLAKAQAEVRSVLGAGQTVPTRVEQLNALEFIEACAHETMRLKPVAPILPQQVYEERVIGGVRIPAGTMVIFLMRPAATSATHFPDPQAFDPSRWLAGTANVAPSSAKRVAMPFGAGPRICPGRYLALLEMKMAMAVILANFNIAEVNTPDGSEAAEHLALTMAPVGLTLKLKRV